jgi:tetratricopeptide (TPR) repeat protein
MTRAAWLIIALCVMLLTPLQRWLDAQPRPAAAADDAPYWQTGRSLRALHLGFHSLLADVYWLRVIQYVGGKVNNAPANQPMSEWGMDALLPLLDVVTELDPHYVAAYRFGATFLPECAPREAAGFVERGLRENPDIWQLYLDLGYLHWQRQDFTAARQVYERGSRVSGAPVWFTELAGAMALKGGDRATARAIYQRVLESSTDEYSREMARLKLQELERESAKEK